MKSLRLALIAAASLAVTTTQAPAAQISGPNAEVTATVDAALQAGAVGDLPKLVAQFAPFFWSGPGAIQGYFSAGGRMYQETQHQDGKTVFSPPSYVYVSGDRAFVVEKVSGTSSVRGKPYSQDGAFAFALARIDGHWKIISQTWTKTSESMNPY